MRIWSIHPRYLDVKGLVALWRETLLARRVLEGRTTGYRNHPQLIRFRAHAVPLFAVNVYLGHVHLEAVRRGYRFDAGKLEETPFTVPVPVTIGQLAYELDHLRAKLRIRDPKRYETLEDLTDIVPHPLFTVEPGGIAAWEKHKLGTSFVWEMKSRRT